jgi:Protein of unknown function (DUF2804)
MRTPESLVSGGVRQYGRFAQRPRSVNPLDEFRGVRRALRWPRLKEWVGFTLIHPDWYSSLIMQDAHYLASSEMYAYDRRRAVLHRHAANRRGGSLGLPAELLAGRCAFPGRGYRLEYDFSRRGGHHSLRLDFEATGTAPAFAGKLELDAGRASPPLSVSARIPGGAMYTHKAVFPVGGVLRVGADEIVFDGARDFAILDEHRSFFPYRTRWLWGTFAMHTGDGIVGANFADRPAVPGEEEESCVWSPAAAEPLSGIRFERGSADPRSPWHVFSRDGRLELTFEPEGSTRVRHQLGVVAIDYVQHYGHYRGVVRCAERAYEVDRVHGVCERMRARL